MNATRALGLFLMSMTVIPFGWADTTAPSAPDWTCLATESAFSPRDTAEGVVFKDAYWLSNGYYHGNVLHRDMWTSKDGVAWTQVSDATPYDGYSELVVYKDQIWAIKGSVWVSPDGVTWTEVLAKTPFGARGYGEVVAYKDWIWQLGSGPDVWRTKDGKDWEKVTDVLPFGDRSATAVTVFQDKLWVLGGKTKGANTPPEQGYGDTTTWNDVWSSEDGVTWTEVTDHAGWPPRQWFGATVYRERLWVIGGYDNVNNTNLGDVWYSEDGKTWHAFTSATNFAPRHEATIYVHDDSLRVVAGNTWPVVNDVWSLALAPGWPKK